MGCSSIWFCCLLYFLFHSSVSMSFPSPSPSSSSSSWCHPDESSTLLHFKNSFSFDATPGNLYCDNQVQVSIRKTWQNGTDCCTWSGVKCDKLTHKVISLGLHCSRLQGVIYSNGNLFFLTHLRSLDLSYNHFYGSQLLAQFGRLISLEHLEAANGFDWKFAILLGYGCGLVIGISVGYMLFSDKRLACFIRKFGGERWIELLKARKKKKKKKKKAHSNTRRRNP